MHTFQPYPLDLLDFDPFKKIGAEWMLITAGDKEKANTMTAAWGGIGVMWGKNIAFVVIRDSRYTKEFVDQQETFSLTFFGDGNKSALKYMGAVSGRDEDKIGNVKMHLDYHQDKTPYIDEGNLVLVCRKMSATRMTEDQFIDTELKQKWYADGDMHTMYIGEIIEVLAR